ncbi:MAG: hypothetical protein ACP5GU_03135 [Thermoprotei archaeon]|jgi:hypothetical protein
MRILNLFIILGLYILYITLSTNNILVTVPANSYIILVPISNTLKITFTSNIKENCALFIKDIYGNVLKKLNISITENLYTTIIQLEENNIYIIGGECPEKSSVITIIVISAEQTFYNKFYRLIASTILIIIGVFPRYRLLKKYKL